MSVETTILLFIVISIVQCQNFEQYATKYNKKYENEHEKNFRRQLYQKKWAMINEVNSQNLRYKMGENKFTDRTEE
jgi:hypothetical protein